MSHKLSQQPLHRFKTGDMAEDGQQKRKPSEKQAADVSSEEQAERDKRLKAMQWVYPRSRKAILGHCTKIKFKGELELRPEGQHLHNRLPRTPAHTEFEDSGSH